MMFSIEIYQLLCNPNILQYLENITRNVIDNGVFIESKCKYFPYRKIINNIFILNKLSKN